MEVHHDRVKEYQIDTAANISALAEKMKQSISRCLSLRQEQIEFQGRRTSISSLQSDGDALSYIKPSAYAPSIHRITHGQERSGHLSAQHNYKSSPHPTTNAETAAVVGK